MGPLLQRFVLSVPVGAAPAAAVLVRGLCLSLGVPRNMDLIRGRFCPHFCEKIFVRTRPYLLISVAIIHEPDATEGKPRKQRLGVKQINTIR